MSTDLFLDNRMTVKMFTGCMLNPEIRMHLSQSQQWKQANIGSEQKLIEIHHQTKDYLGQYAAETELTLAHLKVIQNEIKDLLQMYCPRLDTSKVRFFIFPQVFIF